MLAAFGELFFSLAVVLWSVLGADLFVAELAADGANLRAQRCGEHHDLLRVWRLEKDLLHLGPHVCCILMYR